MALFSPKTEDQGRRYLYGFSLLINVALFSLVSIVLTVLIWHERAISPGRFSDPVHTLLFINGGAAIVATVIAPYLLSTYEKMQMRLAQQNKELRSLHTIDNAISAELQLDVILNVAIKQATLAVDAEFGALWLIAEQDQVKSGGQAFYNVPSHLQAAARTLVTKHGGDSDGQIDTPLLKIDLESSWANDGAAAALKLRNIIMVPIKRHETPLGVLLMGNRGETLNPLAGFTKEDAELLSAIASTVSVAVQNARLYETTQHRGEMLRTLVARTGEAIAASSDASLLMQLLADEAAGILSCERVAVYEYNDSLEQFLPLAANQFLPLSMDDEHQNGSTVIDQFFRQALPMDSMVPPPEEYVPESGGGEYVADVREALGLSEDLGQFLAKPGFRFMLRSRDKRPIGLLCFLNSALRAPADETLAFARALASQAAVALENAQLSEQSHALLAQTQALQDATNRIAAELDIHRVLEGVMDSARRVLDADGYALWNEDIETDSWECRAAHGVGFPIVPGEPPWETDVLNRVLNERGPYVIANTQHTPISLPPGVISRSAEAGKNPVRAILALPLLHAGQATGVMMLYYRRPHVFVPAEVDLAQSFAHQAANALENARLFTELRASYAREKRIAETLQRSLLPPIPPGVGNFEFAHKYQAGLDEAVIGGDFLDFFALTPTKLGLVIADVSGKGLQAAVQTAMIKYTLRAFALEAPDSPALVLERVNNILCSEVTSLQGFVTLFYGVLDIETCTLTYANGGHELPLLCDGVTFDVSPITVADGIALGCMPNVHYQPRTLRFAPGDLLLLYTDGLTEARNDDMEFLGIEGLQEIINGEFINAKIAVETIYERVRHFAGDVLRDDAAMLLIRHME